MRSVMCFLRAHLTRTRIGWGMALPTGPHVPVVHLAREARTVGEMLRLRAERGAARPAVYEKRDGAWVGATWAEFHRRASAVARGLVELGLAPGERVAILGPTSAAWGAFDMGAQLGGLVSFGIYPQQT